MSVEKKDMSGIIVLLLILVIGLALTPTIVELCTNAVAGPTNVTVNLTGAAAAIINLVPLFWIILCIGVVLTGVIVWLKT